ncbi:GntR family transcriptional regulator [Nocardioides sp. Root1257]|uniref:GntR family transcriptional regulator n=1 Tax=unclassified Nocardioides TaxID=2615069 RepID=UPI0006F9944C|nr:MULTISPECIES: GntR family transcriptional regulator [unclassified Nocardioides]KQW46932.1 GntR family transcriptional regulator [Nocardioides sp. Root1257]KRC43679.1 GntR family transcriptional regulator [Nocardioides sp. Root224]
MSATSAAEPVEPAGRADAVADRIRATILAGDFVPGQRLVEAELSDAFGASRGAVRAALLQLDHEGLVERVANRGARVRAVSVEEAVAITEVRMVVEGLCAAKAAENVTDADITELRDIGRRMQEAVRAGEIVVYSQLNTMLHDRVRELAGQPVATEVLSRLLARNVRHQFRLALRPGRPQVSLPEHLAIIDEICSRSPEGAERAARRHVASVIEALRDAT